ncbi:MAG TPA: hypothetical protein VNV65_07480 [Candidatus Solibacter sp.]|nr:hypothetical protein [Candidatus Solibacter sp.]
MAPRRRLLWLAVAVIGVALAAGLILWFVGLDAAPTSRPDRGPTVAVGSAYPMSYVVVYDVTENGVHLWEVLSVQRPLAGSDLTYRTEGVPGRDAQPISGSISTATALYAVNQQGVQLVSGRQPGPAAGDQYIAPEIPELLRRGLASDLTTTRSVGGRLCALYRFAQPPSGPIPPAPGQGDHDDICLAADGLVLAETWTFHGRVALQRTAVDVNASDQPQVDSLAPSPPATAGAKPGAAAAGTLTANPHAATFIGAPPSPTGFTGSGPGYDFRLPDPAAPAQSLATSVVWAYTLGARVITVEAGRQQAGALPWRAGDTAGEPVHLAGLGAATAVVRSDGFELRVDLGGGQWVRVRGTVPLDQLIAYGQLLTHAAAAPTAG